VVSSNVRPLSPPDLTVVTGDIFLTASPSTPWGDQTGNLADLLNNISQDNVDAANLVSSMLGTAADLSGAFGFGLMIVQIIDSGQPDEVLVALQKLQNTITTGRSIGRINGMPRIRAANLPIGFTRRTVSRRRPGMRTGRLLYRRIRFRCISVRCFSSWPSGSRWIPISQRIIWAS